MLTPVGSCGLFLEGVPGRGGQKASDEAVHERETGRIDSQQV
jgi:hypothetical protein